MFGRFCFAAPASEGNGEAASDPSGAAAAVMHIICRNDRRFIGAAFVYILYLVNIGCSYRRFPRSET